MLRVSVVVASAFCLLAGACSGSARRSADASRPPTGTLVVEVVYVGGLTPDGTEQRSPGANARVRVSGRGRTLYLRANAKGRARTSLRPARYRVSIPTTASTSSQPRTAVVRAGRTTTVRLTSVCNTC